MSDIGVSCLMRVATGAIQVAMVLLFFHIISCFFTADHLLLDFAEYVMDIRVYMDIIYLMLPRRVTFSYEYTVVTLYII